MENHNGIVASDQYEKLKSYPTLPAIGQSDSNVFLAGNGAFLKPADVAFDVATHTDDGLMSKEDKTKLDGIEDGAQVNSTVTATPCQNGLMSKEDKFILGALLTCAQETPAFVASQSSNGLMSKEDKTKLDGIESGAQVNSITGVKGDAETNFRTGNVNITAANVGAAAVSHSHTAVTTSSNGFMSAADKSKLDGIAAGAQVNSITGVKGNAESSYRTGSVNLTPANIGAAAAAHGNHVPQTQTANNAVFLRNDNTWQTVTPANIGAASSSHSHAAVTTDSNGFMSAADKQKLDSLSAGLENLTPTIRVFAISGSTVTATSVSDGTVLTATENSGVWSFSVPHLGYWAVRAVKGSAVYTREVYVSEIKTYPMGVGVQVYRYGYRIKEAEPDPYERVEYILDAKGMTPAHMDFDNDVFDYGSWADVWFVKDNKPLMLKSDGTVGYYLNPNDYSKKADGSASDVANADYDGNAMAQFPLCWIYRYEDDTYKYEIVSNVQWDENYKAYAHTRADGSIADYFYSSLFEASGNATKIRSLSGKAPVGSMTTTQQVTAARANGSNWYIGVFIQREFIRTLLVLISKSTNTQLSFGNGRQGSSALKTGTLDDKGQFYGAADSTHQVKTFFIEAHWNNMGKRTAGAIMINSIVYVKLTPEGQGYRISDTVGYTPLFRATHGVTFARSYTCSQYGMWKKEGGASATTYYCDIDSYNLQAQNYGYLLCGDAYLQTQNGYAGAWAKGMSNSQSGSWAHIGCILTCEQPSS